MRPVEHILSQLQHMRHTQPGSPLSAINTDKFLYDVSLPNLKSDREAYTMLLISVHNDPTNVRKATVRRRILAFV